MSAKPEADVGSSGQTLPPQRPSLSWGLRIKRKMNGPPPVLGRFRPLVGQCCHRCTPRSLDWKLLQRSPSLVFQDVLWVTENHIRYRGWLVRRLCCVLFVSSCRVHPTRGDGRTQNRDWKALCSRDQPLPATVSRGQPEEDVQLFLGACISPLLLRAAAWFLLKLLSPVFGGIQVNLNQITALHRASAKDVPLVFVFPQHSALDYALLLLVLFCHNMRLPYTFCHLQPGSSWIRYVLSRLGVIFPPAGSHDCHANLRAAFVAELLRERQNLSFTLSPSGGAGAQQVAYILQAIKEELVGDVCIVPVALSYDRPCQPGQGGLVSFIKTFLWSRTPAGSVRIHFAEAFSLKEMSDTGRWHLDEALTLQELLLPTVLHKRSDAVFGKKSLSYILPTTYCPELLPVERRTAITVTLHLLYSTMACEAIMSTALVSCLLLHKHRRGTLLSTLCQDVSWLFEEVLFRNRDVGFSGSLLRVVFHALCLLRPHLVLGSPLPAKDPLVAPRATQSAVLALSQCCQSLRRVFLSESVGACAVSAMLCEIAGSDNDMEMEFVVTLDQEELTARAVQLCHLLPAGCFPPCQSVHSFAADAVYSLVRCGILVVEEQAEDHHVYDFWKKQQSLKWTVADDLENSSDNEEQEACRYKLNEPSRFPDLLFFLCSLLSVELRALCWAVEEIPLLCFPLSVSECISQLHRCMCDRAKQGQKGQKYYESSSVDMAATAVRTFTDFGVLLEQEIEEGGETVLRLAELFQQADNRSKLLCFIRQFTYE